MYKLPSDYNKTRGLDAKPSYQSSRNEICIYVCIVVTLTPIEGLKCQLYPKSYIPWETLGNL